MGPKRRVEALDGAGVRPVKPRSVDVRLRLPAETILRAFGSVLLAWIIWRLWPEVVFLAISLLLAVSLEPIVAWLERRGLSRALSVLVLAGALLAFAAFIVGVIMPPLASQVAELVANFASVRAKVMGGLPKDNVVLGTVVEQMFLLPSSPAVLAEVNKPLVWGRIALASLMTTFIVVMATLYLLLDGKRLYAWLLAYVPRVHRDKMAQTVPEVSRVVHAYVGGQFITSTLFAVFVAVLLAVLDVPAVLPLALLAGICDVIPVVGIIVATVPAALLALTVSSSTSALVVSAYVVYHLFEAYYIVPRVYGTTLRLSALAVLLALIVGSTLQGLLGAVLVLPLVAAYPIIERIWLAGYLSSDVIADHQALASAIESGSESAVEAVLQGEKHPGEANM